MIKNAYMLITNNILYKLYNSVDLFEAKSVSVCYVTLHKPVGCTSLAHVVKNVIPNVLYTILKISHFFKSFFQSLQNIFKMRPALKKNIIAVDKTI